jgi:hypothetical protein
MSMMGSLPPASVYGTWVDCIEVRSTDDETLYDFSGVTEIRLTLRFRGYSLGTNYGELTLTKSKGDIVLPAPGIIQWRAEQGTMSQMHPGLYEAVLQIEDGSDTSVLVLGDMSIIG